MSLTLLSLCFLFCAVLAIRSCKLLKSVIGLYCEMVEMHEDLTIGSAAKKKSGKQHLVRVIKL